MIPINVTHTAIVTKEMHAQLLSPLAALSTNGILPSSSTNLRHTLSTVISFFADSYKSVFGFDDGPPLHDALTVAYVSCPELFRTIRYHVDVELTGTHSTGETIVDVWNYRSCDDTWGPDGKNCLVAQSVEVCFFDSREAQFKTHVYIFAQNLKVEKFFKLLLDSVTLCDKVSPLNTL